MKLSRRWNRHLGRSVEVSDIDLGRRVRDVSVGVDLTGFCRPHVGVDWYDETELGISLTWGLAGCDPGAHLYLSIVDPPGWLAWLADRNWRRG